MPKGSDQLISAKLAGFRSNDVALMVKKDGEGKFERMPLVASGDPSKFEGMLFNVSKPVEYYVDSDGVGSPTYSMKVVNLPAVEKLELEYVFPAYTGLPPQKVESGGDVAALRGTEVRVRIKPTMATSAGRLQLDPKASAELKGEADGTLAGSFKIDAGRLLSRRAGWPARRACGRVSRSTPWTRLKTSRLPCPSRSRSGTCRPIRSRKCSCRRAPMMTTA